MIFRNPRLVKRTRSGVELHLPDEARQLLVGLHVLGATLVWAATVQVALEVFDGVGGRLDRRWRSAGATRASRGDVPVLSGR